MAEVRCDSCGAETPSWSLRCPACLAERHPPQSLRHVDERDWSEDHLYYLGRFSTVSARAILFIGTFLAGVVVLVVGTTVVLEALAASTVVLDIFDPVVEFLIHRAGDEAAIPILPLLGSTVLHLAGAAMLAGLLEMVGRAALNRYRIAVPGGLLVYGGVLVLFWRGYQFSLFALFGGIVGLYLAAMGYGAVDDRIPIEDEFRAVFGDLTVRSSHLLEIVADEVE